MGDFLEKVAKWLKRIVVIAVALFVVVGLGIGVVDKISEKLEERKKMEEEAQAEKEKFIAIIDDFDEDIRNTCYIDGELDKNKLFETNANSAVYTGFDSYEFKYIYSFIKNGIFYDFINSDLVSDCWVDAFSNEKYCDITRAIVFNNYLYMHESFDELIADRDGRKQIYKILDDKDTGFWLKNYIIDYFYGWVVKDVEALHLETDSQFKVAKRVLNKQLLEKYLLEMLEEASDYDEMIACLQVFFRAYDQDVIKFFAPYIDNPNNYETYKVHAIISQLETVYSYKKEISNDLSILYDKAMEYVSKEVKNMELSEDTVDIYSTYIDMVYMDVSWENAEIVFDKASALDKTNVYSKQVMASYIDIIYRYKEDIISRLKDRESLKSEDINKIIRFVNLAYEYNFLEYSFDDIKLYLIRAMSAYENQDLLENIKYVSREINYDNGYIIAKGDFDGDGADDVGKVHMYVLDGVGNRLELRLGNGDKLDYDFKQEEIGHGYEYSLVFKDLNNDGQAEIVLCSSFKTKGELVNCIMVFEKNGNEYSLISSESLTDWKEQVILDMDEISPFLIDGKTEWEMQEEL